MRPLPFAVKAWFECFVVLVYAVDKEKAAAMLPPPLMHEVHNGKALMAAAFVDTRKLRPAFLPGWLGANFNLAGYRHMVSYKRNNGKVIRGLKIIRSATNKKYMQRGGDTLTEYRFAYNPIIFTYSPDFLEIRGDGIDIKLKDTGRKAEVALPQNSIFESWQHARKFAGPLLYTFEVHEAKNEIVITEGTRTGWQPYPVEVERASIRFFTEDKYADLNPVLSAAYVVRSIPYSWKKAQKETIKPNTV